MFVAISPVDKKIKKEIVEKNDSEEISILTLTPFTPNPKLFFDNVVIGSVAVRKLIIRNPLNRDIELYVNSNFPPECHVDLNWKQIIIGKKDEACLELTWTPQKEGSWRHNLVLDDHNRLKRDVPVAFKSIAPVKTKKVVKKKKLPSFVVKKGLSPGRTIKSPPTPINKKLDKLPLPNITNKPKIISPPFLIRKNGKENNPNEIFDMNNDDFQTNFRRETFTTHNFPRINSDNIDPRRETFTIFTPIDLSSQNNTKIDRSTDMNFEDSLEGNISITTGQDMNVTTKIALTPNDIEKRLKSISFTFSPSTTPQNFIIDFGPDQCSTERKKRPEKFDFLRAPSPVQNENTFNLSVNELNISNETYVKGNLSTETYVKGNLSTETYVKGNISSSTYVKDNSIGDCANLLPQSPEIINNIRPSSQQSRGSLHLQNLQGSGAMGVIQANLWTESTNDIKPLCTIKEETFVDNNCSLSSSSRSILKRKSSTTFCITSPKKLKNYLEDSQQQQQQQQSQGGGGIQDWSKKGSMAYRISRKTSGLNCDIKGENCIDVVKNDISEVIIKNPFLLAATNNLDPFMTPFLHYDEEWITEQETGFKKWLNALLAPPAELNCNKNSHPLDVAKLWKECKKKEVAVAPTKEMVSIKYHTSSRLNSLRRSAKQLYKSPQISIVLLKVLAAIDNHKLSIRKDRDIHLDLGLQSEIMSIFLSYNPLWLRIGLETIYNTVIPLNSNSDVMGLSTFIMERFFKDPNLFKKYKTIHSPKYKEEIKCFLLKKFLALIYFLDQAKEKKLISHDPCLFCKNAPIKESRDALLRFAKETLFAVGDITKYLKYFGYIVQHKQTYINEFDYAVNNLGVDLRDGVRLTRIMEIILLKDNLINKLRVPAISRLQKIHNMKVVFESLQQENFEILHDIDPKDIVDGHKEKTLSLLWQIIHKFQAPLMVKSATIIQKWWKSPAILEKRQELYKIYLRKTEYCRKIQLWYRNIKFAKKLENYANLMRIELENKRKLKAIITIQQYYRNYKLCQKMKEYYKNLRYYTILMQQRIRANQQMKKYRNEFLLIKYSIIKIQQWYKATKLAKIERKSFLTLKSSTIIIQQFFRGYLEMKKQRHIYQTQKQAIINIQNRYRALILMRKTREEFLTLKASTLLIQNYYRAYQKMRKHRNEFLSLKYATIIIQQRYRANIAMKQQLEQFNKMKKATIIIQRHFRATLEMRKTSTMYNKIKSAVLIIQSQYRAWQAMKLQQTEYKKLRDATIIIQRRYRANLEMKKASLEFQKTKNAVIKIQTYFRSYLIMKLDRQRFVKMRDAACCIQNYYRARLEMRKQLEDYQKLRNAVIVIQQRFRANLAMKHEVQEYQQLKTAVLIIQQRFRAQQLMRKELENYQNIRKAVLVIQQRFRATLEMKKASEEYQALKSAAIIIQQKYRAITLMRKDRESFEKLRNAAIKIQRYYRALILMRDDRRKYHEVKEAAIIIQRRYRANLKMKKASLEFKTQKNAAIKIQTYFKSYLLMKLYRQRFVKMRDAACCIQNYYRARLEMKKQLDDYQKLRNAVIRIQQRFRANLAMKHEVQKYQQFKTAVLIIQQRFRAQKLMREEQENYQNVRKAVLTIQQRYRATLEMKKASADFQAQRNAVIKIQTYFRSYLLMKLDRQRFVKMRDAACCIQNYYRARLEMKKQLDDYQKFRNAVIVIQQRFRANLVMKHEVQEYQQFKTAVLIIQQRFRAQQLMRKELENYQNIRKAILVIQQRFRATLEMKKALEEYRALKSAAIIIQKKYRATILMQKEKESFERLRNAAIVIQNRYRALMMMRNEMRKYEEMKEATIIIQRRYRANLEMKKAFLEFQTQKNAVIKIQTYFKSYLLMKLYRERFVKMREAACCIQTYYRATLEMRKQLDEYHKFRNAVIVIQQRFRANIAMKHEVLKYNQIKTAVSTIQQRFRAQQLMREEQENYQNIRKTILVIQQRFRATLEMKKASEEYQALKSAAKLIQRKYRATLLMRKEKESFEKLRNAAIIIQRRYRALKMMRKEMKKFAQIKFSIILIQRWYRTMKAIEEKQIYLVKIETIENLQRYIKGFLLRKKYAYELSEEGRKERRLQKLREKSATVIQAHWRGYKVRLVENPKLKLIRQRSAKANSDAVPEKTLGHKCKQALMSLGNEHTTIHEIIRAFDDIDFITRRCKKTCLKMSTILSEHLYKIITSTSRSLPEMQVCTVATYILVNFAKYPPSRANSWVPTYLDKVVTLMMHWCDKDVPLFPALCTLLWLFVQNEEYKNQVLTIPDIHQKILRINNLLVRKQKMVQKIGVKGASVFSQCDTKILPSLTPDWGLEIKEKPRLFSNSPHAFKCLMNCIQK